MTLEESLLDMTDMLFDEDLLRVALCSVCGSLFFTAAERRCALCNYKLTPDEEAQLWRLLKR